MCSRQRREPAGTPSGSASPGQASSVGVTQTAFALVRSVPAAAALTATVGTRVALFQLKRTVWPSVGTLKAMLALPPPSP